MPSVLLVSSNGAGMGHLTRLLAYAVRMAPGTRRQVLSMSQAVPVVGRAGLPWEYLPSQGATGLRPAAWRAMFADRLAEVLDRVDPDVLVFDGTHPYAGLDVALATHPRTRAVWSRRAMWKPGLNVDQLDKEAWFDLVLEPGDLSSAADRGATVTGRPRGVAEEDRPPVERVRPITLVDRGSLSTRAAARAALGLPPDGPLALVALGAGNINDVSGEVGAAATALRSRGIGVCVTSAPIADRTYADDHVHLVQHFPLSEHLAAFDYAIGAAGYNFFHETLRFGVPTLLVPNQHTSLDDQSGRAQEAARRGWALSTPTLVGLDTAALVDELVERGADRAARAQAEDPGNGAADAADILTSLSEQTR